MNVYTIPPRGALVGQLGFGLLGLAGMVYMVKTNRPGRAAGIGAATFAAPLLIEYVVRKVVEKDVAAEMGALLGSKENK